MGASRIAKTLRQLFALPKARIHTKRVHQVDDRMPLVQLLAGLRDGVVEDRLGVHIAGGGLRHRWRAGALAWRFAAGTGAGEAGIGNGAA